MDDFIEVSRGKSLMELLEEKHSLPITILKYPRCASCAKDFTRHCQPAAEIHAAPDGLRLPILYLCELCQVCAARYRAGGRRQRAVLAAVQEFLAREDASS
jgi:hypothetical protein